jgi:hypothetical protein
MRRSLDGEKRYTQHLERELKNARSSPALPAKYIKEQEEAERQTFGRP